VIPVVLPATEENAEKAAASARKDGCKPKWSDYYECFCCTCPGLDHSVDSQCSAISLASARHWK
jgi:hypothetical protein